MHNAAIVLLLAALGGAFVASYPLRGKGNPPTPFALVHGLLAFIGLILLFNAYRYGQLPRLAANAFLVLVLGALGGATMFFGFHLRGKAIPKPFVVGHALVALTGLVMLWVEVSRYPG